MPSLGSDNTSHSKQEPEEIWKRSDLAKLLKLYDKTSNLLDAPWKGRPKWKRDVDLVLRLADFVESRYGPLNIVRIARGLAGET